VVDKFLSATEFARAILQVEGMNPEYEANWLRRIEERFVARFGPSVSPQSRPNEIGDRLNAVAGGAQRISGFGVLAGTCAKTENS
jgi:hypothetical protein